MYRALVAGLAAGCVAALVRLHVPGWPDVFVNSISTWLLLPFLVGLFTSSVPRAVVACLAQLAAFYIVAGVSGLGTTVVLVAVWTVFAVGGGSVFGAAGRWWREGGLALLGAVFVLEGVLDTGWVWVAVGVALTLSTYGLHHSSNTDQGRTMGKTRSNEGIK
ncbi:DUF6518 family protein [Solirubrobacter taibaiensis]|nr:DUF6518 family protein [Solirubrobacter taibaiensis]